MRSILCLSLVVSLLHSATLLAQASTPVVSLHPDDVYNADLSVARVKEDAGQARFRVRLSQASRSRVSVLFITERAYGYNGNYELIDNLWLCEQGWEWDRDETCIATPGSDYYGVAKLITFAPGETEKQIGVQIIDNGLAELNQFFKATLVRPDNARLAPRRGTPTSDWWVFIEDSDVSPSNSVVTISYPSEFVFPAPFSEGVGTIETALVLRPASPWPVEVTVSSFSIGGSVDGEDYQGINRRVLFKPGETSKPIPIVVYDDDIPEPTEGIGFSLSRPVGATISPPHREFGPRSIAIIDNDTLPEVGFDRATVTVTESDGTVTLWVSARSRIAEPINALAYTQAIGSATPGRDYWGTAQSVTVRPGSFFDTGLVTINLIDDQTAEAPESFQVRLVNAQDATIVESVVTVIVVDDDN